MKQLTEINQQERLRQLYHNIYRGKCRNWLTQLFDQHFP